MFDNPLPEPSLTLVIPRICLIKHIDKHINDDDPSVLKAFKFMNREKKTNIGNV